MGNELANVNGKLDKPPVRTADPTGRTEQRNSRPQTPGTQGTGTPPNGGTPTGTPAGKAEEKKASGLAPVTPPAVEGSAPAPAPPQKQAKRKKTPKKKEPDNSFTADQISALIVSVSAVAASRPGLEMFAITEPEAKTIAVPLSNIFAKSEQFSKLGEHADTVALVTACIVVMAPRLLMYFEMKKQKKIAASGGVKIVKQESKSVGSNNGTPKSDSPRTENNAESATALLPSFI